MKTKILQAATPARQPVDMRPVLERHLNEREVSGITGRSVASLRRDRLVGAGISYIKCGALVRYDPRDVWDYLQRNRRAIGAKAAQ